MEKQLRKSQSPLSGPSTRRTSNPATVTRVGVAYGIAAYGFWGLAPIYFKAVANIPALEVLAHRIVWLVVLLAVFISITRRWYSAVTFSCIWTALVVYSIDVARNMKR